MQENMVKKNPFLATRAKKGLFRRFTYKLFVRIIRKRFYKYNNRSYFFFSEP